MDVGNIDGIMPPDLVIGSAAADFNSRSNSGSVFILSGSILGSYSGIGNTIDLADTSKYSIRFDGASI